MADRVKALVYPAPDGWRWNVKGANNEILCSGEAYISREDAEYVIELLWGRRIPLDVVVQNHGREIVNHYTLGRPNGGSGEHEGDLDELYTGPLEAEAMRPDIEEDKEEG